jgi:hypothetical protein
VPDIAGRYFSGTSGSMKVFAGYFYPIPMSVWNKSASDDYYNVHGRSAGIKSFRIELSPKEVTTPIEHKVRSV